MLPFHILGILVALLVFLGIIETLAHRRRLSKIPIRIHVNGTRGKSSVTRLIASGLREGGIVNCAKTTGTLPRLILPDGREVPVYRPSKANVIEQLRIVAAVKAQKAKAIVIECMALQPEYQWLSEAKFVRATHGVITNAREDHLDVMGPTEADVAKALCGMVPYKAKFFTAERDHLPIMQKVTGDRKTELIGVTEQDVAAITEEELDGFIYREHAENVALALKVCASVGIERNVALAGMQKTPPDPGAMTEHTISFFGKKLTFVNGFAANDPESTERIWNMALERHEKLHTKIAVFNVRADRPDRSIQLGRAYVKWVQADWVVLMGDGTYIFARAAAKAGLDETKIIFAEGKGVNEIFETIIGLVPRSGLVMGMANIYGQGLDLVSYFKNREAPEELE